MALQGIEVEGIIIKEYPAKEGVSKTTGNPWKSQEFVIQTKDQYPRSCLFRVFGADKIAQFNIHQGDNVRVWLDINARAWQDRYFNDISAFRVDHLDANMGTTDMDAPVDPFAGQDPAVMADTSSDLPF